MMAGIFPFNASIFPKVAGRTHWMKYWAVVTCP